MDVGGWLRRLGLEQYEASFRENKIDDTVLPRLTAEDLKDLGVGFVGHRRKLLDAIAALRAQASAPTPPLSDAPLAIDKAAKDTAERRQVTVMFSDLVGSTALSARMDPEDLREVISAYQKCVAETVRRCGGFVAKYMGDGVLIYFGYPQAHEDDAERAVRAGLELIAAVTALKSPVPLQTRVGIATGLVVVGDLIGSGEAQEHGIVGETPNLAARLQGIAEPNMVVIAEATRRLLGNLFELRGPRGQGPQGYRRAGASLGGVAGEFGGRPLRGAAHGGPDRAGRAGRRTRIASAALVEGKEWVKARWCCSPARQVSGSRDSRRHFWNASPAKRIRACAISARRSTRTVHSIRSLARWSAPPDWRMTTNRKRSSTSLMRFSHRPRPRRRMPHSSPRCCRFRMMGAIPRLT